MTPRSPLLVLLAAALLLTGCRDDDGSEPSAGPSTSATASATATATGQPAGGSDLKIAQGLPVLARVKGTEFGSGITLDLLGVERTSDMHATARFLLTVDEQDKNGGRVSTFSLGSTNFGSYLSGSLSDVRLVDEAAGETLAPLTVNGNRCLCSSLPLTPPAGVAGQQAVFVTFPAPAAGTEQVAVQAGDFPLTPPVELTPPGRVAFTDEPPAATVATAKATRFTLISRSAALDGASRRTDRGNTVAVDVSADVLFAFGSAELTPAAQATLQDVATEVKTRAAGPVEIVGHTDTVGDSAANQTLSLRRAQAVLAALQPQAPGLSLTASGRGESEPVAEDRGRGDSTEAALNRRVTVRYPVAPPPLPPPAQPGAEVVAPDAAAVSSLSGDGRLFEVLELRRLSDGIVQGTFRLTNQASDGQIYQRDFLEQRSPNPYSGATLSGLRLVDQASGSAYAPLVDSSRICLCTELVPRPMKPGQTSLLYASFKAPPTTSTTVDISVPSFKEPLTGVPIR